MFHKLTNFWRNIRFANCFIIADPRDNSISFSRALFRNISKNYKDTSNAKAIIVNLGLPQSFGIVINPAVSSNVAVADIQYNNKFRTIGFESLSPSVNALLYHLGIIDISTPVRLSVIPASCGRSQLFYKIISPCK